MVPITQFHQKLRHTTLVWEWWLYPHCPCTPPPTLSHTFPNSAWNHDHTPIPTSIITLPTLSIQPHQSYLPTNHLHSLICIHLPLCLTQPLNIHTGFHKTLCCNNFSLSSCGRPLHMVKKLYKTRSMKIYKLSQSLNMLTGNHKQVKWKLVT